MFPNMMPKHSTDLPVTRNMPFYSASVPSRNSFRNMTGIYLGLEGNANPPRGKNAPVLARGRGVPQRIRTPTEERRHKMVELLRIKEEKRGFVGKPLKAKSSKKAINVQSSTENKGQIRAQTAFERESLPRATRSAKQWGPGRKMDPNNLDDIVKPNPRKYTVISNSGVTRSENLSGWMSFMMDNDELSVPFSDALTEEVHRLSVNRDDLTGLEECYNKVCKGNIGTLQTLIPYRKAPQVVRESNDYDTGFSVRSYRNPNKAEILANFTEANAVKKRPKTVPNLNAQRPFVPGPYFFRYSGPEDEFASRRKKGAVSEADLGLFDASKIIAAPGVGGLTKFLKSHSPQPETFSISPGTPCDSYQSKVSEENQEGNPVKISMQVPSDTTEIQEQQGEITPDPIKSESEEQVVVKMNGVAQGNGVSRLTSKLADMPKQSSVEIMIGLENENGEKDAPEIDLADDDDAIEQPAGECTAKETGSRKNAE